MSNQDIQELDYQTVRRRVVRRFFKRLLFALDVFLFIIAIANNRPDTPDDDGFIVLWSMLLLVHFVYAFEIWSRIVDWMTQREIAKLQRKGYWITPSIDETDKKTAVKAKREAVARLSDDGEIVYEEEPARAASRRGK